MSSLLSWHHWTSSCPPLPPDNWTSSTWGGNFYRYVNSSADKEHAFCLSLYLSKLMLSWIVPSFPSLPPTVYSYLFSHLPSVSLTESCPSTCVLVLFELSSAFNATLCHYTSMDTVLTAHHSCSRLSTCLIVLVLSAVGFTECFLWVERVSALEGELWRSLFTSLHKERKEKECCELESRILLF